MDRGICRGFLGSAEHCIYYLWNFCRLHKFLFLGLIFFLPLCSYFLSWCFDWKKFLLLLMKEYWKKGVSCNSYSCSFDFLLSRFWVFGSPFCLYNFFIIIISASSSVELESPLSELPNNLVFFFRIFWFFYKKSSLIFLFFLVQKIEIFWGNWTGEDFIYFRIIIIERLVF